MEFTYRTAGPSDRENYLDFINYVFGHAHEPTDFKTLLPKEYADGHGGHAVHFLALDAQERIRAVVALLPFTLNIGEHKLKCGFIGSVSVHPYARGEGHMKKLMAMADSWMEKKGIDLAVLGGLRQRYQYFGYTKGGLQVSYCVNSDNIRHALKDSSADGFQIQEITDETDMLLSEIYTLHQMSPVRADRNPEELLPILHSYGRQLYALMEHGNFAGYFTACRNTVGELTVKNPAHYKPALKCWMQTKNCSEITLSVSSWDSALMRTLDAIAESAVLTTGENYKVYQWSKALPAFLTLKRIVSGHISDGSCHLCIDGQKIALCCEGGQITVSGNDSAASASTSPDENSASVSSPIWEEYTALELQEKIFASSGFLRPCYIGGAPADWFPIPLSVPVADQF